MELDNINVFNNYWPAKSSQPVFFLLKNARGSLLLWQLISPGIQFFEVRNQHKFSPGFFPQPVISLIYQDDRYTGIGILTADFLAADHAFLKNNNVWLLILTRSQVFLACESH
jgi:hypothetical protein